MCGDLKELIYKDVREKCEENDDVWIRTY